MGEDGPQARANVATVASDDERLAWHSALAPPVLGAKQLLNLSRELQRELALQLSGQIEQLFGPEHGRRQRGVPRQALVVGGDGGHVRARLRAILAHARPAGAAEGLS